MKILKKINMRFITDEEMFELVRNAYSQVNKDYLEKQSITASECLTEEQKKKSCCKKVYQFKLS